MTLKTPVQVNHLGYQHEKENTDVDLFTSIITAMFIVLMLIKYFLS